MFINHSNRAAPHRVGVSKVSDGTHKRVNHYELGYKCFSGLWNDKYMLCVYRYWVHLVTMCWCPTTEVCGNKDLWLYVWTYFPSFRFLTSILKVMHKPLHLISYHLHCHSWQAVYRFFGCSSSTSGQGIRAVFPQRGCPLVAVNRIIRTRLRVLKIRCCQRSVTLWQVLVIPQGSQLKQAWPLMLSTCTSGWKHAAETAWLSSGATLLALGQWDKTWQHFCHLHIC